MTDKTATTWRERIHLTAADVLDAGEVAEILKCSRRTVYRRFEAGDIPGVRIGPRHVVFSRRKLDAVVNGDERS